MGSALLIPHAPRANVIEHGALALALALALSACSETDLADLAVSQPT